MGKRLSRFAGAVIRLFSRPMKTTWEEEYQGGPCVFVVSREGPASPALFAARFPERDRCRMWIQEEMLSSSTARKMIRREGWWRRGGVLEPLHRVFIPLLGGAVVPKVLSGWNPVAVYSDRRMMLTLRESVRILRKDECVVIFPEKTEYGSMHRDWISTGFLRLGELGYRACGRVIKFYPVRVDTKKHAFEIGAPVRYNPALRFSEQEKNLAERLAAWLRNE